MSQVVVLGAGTGGAQTVVALRDLGHEGPITLVGQEPGLPYQRPPLSKARLHAPPESEAALIRPRSYYERHGVTVLSNMRATAIDPGRRLVELENGSPLAFDRLVIATGARNRVLDLEGSTLDGVLYLRTEAEADRLRPRLTRGARVLIVGAGYIGLEVAAAAQESGAHVTVIERLPSVLSRSVSPAISRFFLAEHRARGVEVLLDAQLSRFEGPHGRVTAAVLESGERIAADTVVIGVGVVPNTELAELAGLAVTDGVVVDEQLRTDDRDIFAIGDCASFPCSVTGRRQRLESVQNASDQARCIARQLAGDHTPYHAVPWFWSQQFGHRLQIAGVAQATDEAVLRGDPSTGSFSVCRFSDGRLVAVESVSRVADHMAARRLLRQNGAAAIVTPEIAGDDTVSLKELARA